MVPHAAVINNTGNNNSTEIAHRISRGLGQVLYLFPVRIKAGEVADEQTQLDEQGRFGDKVRGWNNSRMAVIQNQLLGRPQYR